MALRDQPYLPLYVQDFMTDEKLAECSATANGVYIRIMCLLHKSEEYGTILLKQKDKQNSSKNINFAHKLAKFMPYPYSDVLSGLEELLNENVLMIEGDKLIQKRMLKDSCISDSRSKAGKNGYASKTFAQAKPQANSQANPEYENESVSYNEGIGNNIIPDFQNFVPPSVLDAVIVRPPNAPEFQKVLEFFVGHGKTEADATTFFNHFEGLGWRKGISPIFAWRSIANNWIANIPNFIKNENDKKDIPISPAEQKLLNKYKR